MGKAELQASLNSLDMWLLFFGALAAVGAVGASFVGYIHWRRAEELQTVMEAESEALRSDVSKANDRARQAQLDLEKYRAPRSLSNEQIANIAAKIASFRGLRVVLGAIPPSDRNTIFLDRLLTALKIAEVDAFINLAGVEALVSPTGASNRGQLLTQGFPSGVSVFYVTGNERGENFSKTFALALNDAGVMTKAVSNWRDAWVAQQMKAYGKTINDKDFEPVTIVVGDKP